MFLSLDNKELTTSKNSKKDARSAWNGNELKGMEKTILIAVNLKAGKHIINLSPHRTPFLKSIVISKVEENKITYIPVKNNNPAQKSEGRPWLSYIILDLFITKLFISAEADKNGRDDDDIKLIINGEIQKNENKRAHQDWYWCGKILKGKEKAFSREIDSQTKQYNLDLYSDGTPRLSKLEISIKQGETKRIPTVNDPLWTGDFRDDTDEMLLARLIFGEANGEPREAKIWVAWSVINRTKANSWWEKTIKGAILQKGQYDPIKPNDPNFDKIINPPNSQSWHECYEIANDVISGKISNPTEVTHFIGLGADKKLFEKNIIPKGKLLKKIGNTYFYWSPN
ncbi:MAG: cell wall hydrolase [Patescibacteria group bacterium]|nr:cell wall hydrolase [Patescibacteria group bacterium]